ncbi:tetratricopeptide repeat protein [Skeletonema marinoi]|uniref:Tetratricopeptide repeat protein n=1 Tax=Skeletonema marinoi TaxID=267567 RepID=A0AAD8YKH4_9STRA|nr:tetratricopeptide repeat protein [Skeletonema marinoi]
MNSLTTDRANSSNSCSIGSSKRKRGSISFADQTEEDVVATTNTPAQNDIVLLNNLGVDCFEHGILTDATKCFQNAMEIFSSRPGGSITTNLTSMSSQVSCISLDSSSQSSPDKVLVTTSAHDQDVIMEDAESAASDSEASGTEKHQLSTAPIQGSPSPPRSEYDEGMTCYNRPLRIDNSKSDDYHSTAPMLLFNVGQLHSLEGDDTTAERYFLQALDILQQRFESNHRDEGMELDASARLDNDVSIDAIPILHNLARIYYRAQNYKLAMDMYFRALDIAQQDEQASSSLANTLNCIGVLFFHMGGNTKKNATKALDMFNASLVVRKNLIEQAEDPNHNSYKLLKQELATTMNNKGRIHYMLGDHNAALVTYIDALKLRREILPSLHLDLAASAYNLGQTYHQLGNLTEAMELYHEFHSIITRIFVGKNHRDLAIILKCMAQVHHDQSQYEEAARLYYKSLETTKAALGDFHPEVASLLNKIGNMHYENSDFSSAIRVYEEGLVVEQAVLQHDHPNIVVTLTNIAQSQKHEGNYYAALERYVEAHALQKAILGDKDPKVAVTLSNVAQVSCRLGRFTRAFDAYQEVLQIRRDAFGDDHVEVAATLNSIGLVLFKQGFHGLAIESFRESLRVRKLCLGSQHRDVAVVLYNIATTHLEQGDEELATEYYAETLRVERTALGNDHRDLAVTLQHIGQIHRQRGELDVALGYFKEALRIEKLNLGDSTTVVARLLNKMGNIYLAKADVINMMQCFTEATRIYELCGETDNANGDLEISGYNFYCLSITNPECAAAA